jgi:hypothetical protein
MRAFVFLALLTCTGCLDRIETITVRTDGSIEIEHRLEGDGDDLDGGACRRPQSGPWTLKRWTTVQDSGDERHHLSARATFARAEAVPRRFGRDGDPLAERALQFDTKLVVREGRDRTYYRFERTYEPRAWAPYDYRYRRAFPGDLYDVATKGEGLDELDDEQRRALVDGLLRLSRETMQYWADRAIARHDEGEEHVPDTQIAVRAVIDTYFRQHVSAEAFLTALKSDVDRIDALTEGLYRDVTRLTLQAWAEARGAEDPTLAHALALERHDYDVTHDLEDESFTVRVKMPGRVLGHNADAAEDGYLVWKFHGRDLRDRRQRLVATSEVR